MGESTDGAKVVKQRRVGWASGDAERRAEKVAERGAWRGSEGRGPDRLVCAELHRPGMKSSMSAASKAISAASNEISAASKEVAQTELLFLLLFALTNRTCARLRTSQLREAKKNSAAKGETGAIMQACMRNVC